MIENDILKSIKIKFNAAIQENEVAITSGACNYNPHLAVRKKHEEVGLHSNFLHSLLNPHGDHFRGSEFLYSFLRAINAVDDSEETIKKFAGAKVTREKHKIDLLIEAEDHWYIIENKIYAADQSSQINRYMHHIETIEKTRKNNDNSYVLRKISVIYLTLSGVRPSEKSLKEFKNEKKENIARLIISTEDGIPLLLASYKQVQSWCNQCLTQDYVTNSPALYYSIASYKQVLDRLLGGKAAYGTPSSNGKHLSIITNEDFFLSLTEKEQKEFIDAANYSDNSNDSFLDKSLITNGKIKAPRMLLQSIFNGLLLRFRDSVYSEAAMHGFVVGNSRDGFKLNGKNIKLLETPINWYTQKTQRTGKHQFMVFKPRDTEDGFWYVIYFAKHAFYHGFIKIKDQNLQEMTAEDFLLRDGKKCELLSRMKPYEWSPNGKLYVENLGVAHYEGKGFKQNDETTFDNYTTVMQFLLNPKIFYKDIMKPIMNDFWGGQDEGSDRSTRKLFLHVVD